MPTPPDSRVRRVFRIKGRVQGVYFRHSTRIEAERLGIAGMVRNLPDGSVEVVAHGHPAVVESLREWLHRGPSQAKVTAVEELPPGNESMQEPYPSGFFVG